MNRDYSGKVLRQSFTSYENNILTREVKFENFDNFSSPDEIIFSDKVGVDAVDLAYTEKDDNGIKYNCFASNHRQICEDDEDEVLINAMIQMKDDDYEYQVPGIKVFE